MEKWGQDGVWIPEGAEIQFQRISDHGLVNDKQKFTVYYLEVHSRHAQPNHWTVFRRYDDFRKLNDDLTIAGYRIPLLPPKKFIGNFSDSFLKQRQIDLEKWLKELNCYSIANPSIKSPLASEYYQIFMSLYPNIPPEKLTLEVPRISIESFENEKKETKTVVSPPSARVLTSTNHVLKKIGHVNANSFDDLQIETQSSNGSNNSDEESSIAETLDDEVHESNEDSEQMFLSPLDTANRVNLNDFDQIRVIGKGSFGKVILVKKKNAEKYYAMKVLIKDNIMRKNQVEHTKTERRVLEQIDHPFIVKLHYAFQTTDRLYFILDFCAGGELFFHLSKLRRLNEKLARLYSAEIVLALGHLHSRGIIYRDLKPENILLSSDGHIKLADFGLAKQLNNGIQQATSLCGTPEYLPPEILDHKGYGYAVDWWNLGMVLYEMLTGLPPWYTTDQTKLFERIRKAKLTFPSWVSSQAGDIIRKFLHRVPDQRLGGVRDVDEVKEHIFFSSIDWEMLYRKEIEPGYMPCAVNNNKDVSNFSKEFTNMAISIDEHKSFRDQNIFENFTFYPETGFQVTSRK